MTVDTLGSQGLNLQPQDLSGDLAFYGPPYDQPLVIDDDTIPDNVTIPGDNVNEPENVQFTSRGQSAVVVIFDGTLLTDRVGDTIANILAETLVEGIFTRSGLNRLPGDSEDVLIDPTADALEDYIKEQPWFVNAVDDIAERWGAAIANMEADPDLANLDPGKVFGLEFAVPVDLFELTGAIGTQSFDEIGNNLKNAFDNTGVGITLNPSALFNGPIDVNSATVSRATKGFELLLGSFGILGSTDNAGDGLGFLNENYSQLFLGNGGSTNMLKVEARMSDLWNIASFEDGNIELNGLPQFNVILIDIDKIVGQEGKWAALTHNINGITMKYRGDGYEVAGVWGLNDDTALLFEFGGSFQGTKIVTAVLPDINTISDDQTIVESLRKHTAEDGTVTYGREVTDISSGDKFFVALTDGETNLLLSTLENGFEGVADATPGLSVRQREDFIEISNRNVIVERVAGFLDNPVVETVTDVAFSLPGWKFGPVAGLIGTGSALLEGANNFFEDYYAEVVGTENFSAENLITAQVRSISSDQAEYQNIANSFDAEIGAIKGEIATLNAVIAEAEQPGSANAGSLPNLRETRRALEHDIDTLELQKDSALSEAELGIEMKIEAYQAVINRAIRQEDLDVEDVYAALDAYANDRGAIRSVLPGLDRAIARRLLGDNNALPIAEDGTTIDRRSDFIVNISLVGITSDRPEALKILDDTENLTSLSGFDINRLGNVSDVNSLGYITTALIEDQGVDPLQVYSTLQNSKDDGVVAAIVDETPSLRLPALINDALEKSFGNAEISVVGESGQETFVSNFHDLTLGEKFRFINQLAGDDPANETAGRTLRATVQDLPSFITTYRKVLTGEIEIDPELAAGYGIFTPDMPVGGDAGLAQYDIFLEDVAVNLLTDGFIGETGIADLDAKIDRFELIRDSGIPVADLADEYGISDELANAIGAARNATNDGNINFFQRFNRVLGLGDPTQSGGLYLDDNGVVLVASNFGLPREDGALFPDLPSIIPRTDEIIDGPFPPEPESVLSPAQQDFQAAVNTIPADAPDRDARIRVFYDQYLMAPNEDGTSNFDAYWEGRTDVAGEADPTSKALYDAATGHYADLYDISQNSPDAEARASARAALETELGLIFDEEGYLDRSDGSGMLQISGGVYEFATDPENTAAIQAIMDGDGTAAEKDAALRAFVATGEVPVAQPPDLTGEPPEEAKSHTIRFFSDRSDAAFAAGRNAEGFFWAGLSMAISVSDTSAQDGAFFAGLFDSVAPLLDRAIAPDGSSDLFSNTADNVFNFLDENGALPTGDVNLTLASLEFIGAEFVEAGLFADSDTARFTGVGLQTSARVARIILDPNARGTDAQNQPRSVGAALESLFVDVLVDLSQGVEGLEQIALGYDFLDDGWDLLNGDAPLQGENIADLGAFVASFFDDETATKITQGFALGSRGYSLFTGKFEAFDQKVLEQIGLGDLGTRLSSSAFYQTAGTVSAAVALFVDVLEWAGVDVPPEASAIVQWTASAFAGPVGWASIAIDIGLRLFGGSSGTEISTYLEGVDADRDGAFDDTVLQEVDWKTNFWRERKVQDGRIVYDVETANPALLESATFDLHDGRAREMTFSERHIEVDGFADNRETETFGDAVIIEGHRVEGTIVYPDETGRNGLDGAIIPRGETVQATFVPDEGALDTLIEQGIVLPDPSPIPIAVTRRQNIQYKDWDGSGGLENITDLGLDYELSTEWKAENLAPSISIDAQYGMLNPETDGEDFQQDLNLTPAEYDAILAELGTAEPVTIGGDNALVTEPSTTRAVLSRIDTRFESRDRVANVYTYIDANRDGSPDRMRYGINEGGDGLNSGDERYEITFLDPEGNRIGTRDAAGNVVVPVPTAIARTQPEAGDLASLSPYLFRWAAVHPELAVHGYDPATLANLAAEAGDLDDLRRLRSLDDAVNQGAAMQGYLAENPDLDLPAEAQAEAVTIIDAGTAARGERQVLAAELGLFDPDAYLAANPHLDAIYADSPSLTTELTWHYITVGSAGGDPIQGDEVLAAREAPVLPQYRSVGAQLSAGETMYKDEMLVSENGLFAAVFDAGGDTGNLALYDLRGETPQQVWVSNDGGDNTDDGWMVMQYDGNLVIYDDNDTGFSTGTHAEDGQTHGAFALRLENDGNLVVRDQISGDVLWVGGAGEHNNDGNGTFVRGAVVTDDEMFPPGATDSANAARQSILFSNDGAYTYLASNPELMEAWQAEGGSAVLFARRHFQQTGQFAEVDMSFDPEGYISAPGNNDLFMAFANDPEGAVEHYVEFGFAENAAGTRPQLSLDDNDTPNSAALNYDAVMTTELGAVLYVASSPDLIEAVNEAGVDTAEGIADWARTHFLSSGWSEDRTIDFDLEGYMAEPEQSDVIAYYGSDARADIAAHWVDTGHNEVGRIYAAGYGDSAIYADWAATIGDEVAEDRPVPTESAEAIRDEVMSTEDGAYLYLASDVELVRAANEAGGDPVAWARDHFIRTGQFEEVDLSFDPEKYIAAPGNDDLFMAFREAPQDAIRHFVDTGVSENTEGTRPQLYLDENDTPNSAAANYDRVMETELGAVLYVASSPDLIEAVNAAGVDTAGGIADWARTHFLSSGWSEERKIDFDLEGYMAEPEQSDVIAYYGADARADIAAHWVDTGHAEAGRVYETGYGDNEIAAEWIASIGVEEVNALRGG